MTIREEAEKFAENMPTGTSCHEELHFGCIAREAYLAAFEGPTVQALVEALKFYSDDFNYMGVTKDTITPHPVQEINGPIRGKRTSRQTLEVFEDHGDKAREALQKWEERKG